MNFFTAILTSVLAASSLVFAAPTRHTNRDITVMATPQQNSAGAVYCEYHSWW